MADVKVVELRLPDGGTILARAERVDGGGGPADVGVERLLSFAAVGSAVRGVATSVYDAIQTVRPDVAEVEFGLEMALKGSKLVAMLVDGEGKATLRVRLEWRKDPLDYMNAVNEPDGG